MYNREALSKPDDILLKTLFQGKKLVIVDEAQKVQNIGSILKVIHDHIPEVQVIATGSSSFELSKYANENLTGRAIEFYLYPLSVAEITQKYNILQLPSKIQEVLQYGLYPGVFDHSQGENIETLKSIVNNYLYKDILEFSGIRKSEVIINLLQLLALQVGGEVSYTKLANQLHLNTVTVQNYVDLLEKSFVIYKLKGFSRNLRNEITKTVKIYFWDIGILNSLINNFNALSLRSDKGGLWENFCITERLKHNANKRLTINSYFRRTHDQQEIDYIEEKN
ncbi:MAG: ATP-binding protein [Candidatus Peribacteria bacterium]|nr:ATP-binding protein [Candidatus Peribacteria bacterium]